MLDRECRNFPSAPLIAGVMTILGNRREEHAEGADSAPAVKMLMAPFHPQTWILIAFMFFILFFNGLFLSRRYPAYQHNRVLTYLELLHGNIGAPNNYLGIASYLFRISLLVSVVVFFLFYEAAVVNFLFQRKTPVLSKTVRSLSQIELRSMLSSRRLH